MSRVVRMIITITGMLDMVRQRLQRLPEGVTAEDEATLAHMRDVFSVNKLKKSGLLQGTRFKEGGHFFFSTLPNGNLAAEGAHMDTY